MACTPRPESRQASSGSDTTATSMTVAANRDESMRKAELVQLEREWAKALQAHATAFFQRTFAPNFMATTGSGTVDRAGMIKDAGDTNVTFMDTGDEDQTVRLYSGGNVGVVTGRVRGVIQGEKAEDESACQVHGGVRPSGWPVAGRGGTLLAACHQEMT